MTNHAHTIQPTPPRRRRAVNPFAGGEPMVWLTGGSVAAALLAIVALLAFIAFHGFATFWPARLCLLKVKADAGAVQPLLGEPTRQESFTLPSGQPAQRTLYRTGNFELTNNRFSWVATPDIIERSEPKWALAIERTSWGNAYGVLEGAVVEGKRFDTPESAWAEFNRLHAGIRGRLEEIRQIETGPMGDVAAKMNELAVELRALGRRAGEDSPQYIARKAEIDKQSAEYNTRTAKLQEQIASIRTEAQRARLIVRAADGRIIPEDPSRPDAPLLFSQIVRAYPANQLDLAGRLGVYRSRWWEYLSGDPREANMEGGVFPAIFSTVLLTFIMIVLVVPVGVIAAIYLREYARQGVVLSIVRISVNNLAGVPSIVYGVFGLGFFCYLIGGSIDQFFFADRLPDPTVGKSALIWASLTLALLTLPVVIVATEEALAAVPCSMREGSYACGASKWQTIRRIVLPRALPGIMTGMILAIARGAGDVAPLMLVGAVKWVKHLPVNGEAPFFGTNQSFMHLGFHLYDLGFQSPDSEAARSMVFTTTFLLILIVVLLNLAAMTLRTRLRKTYEGGHF